MRLDVAVQAPLDLGGGLLRAEAELHFRVEAREALGELRVLHLAARRRTVVVAVRPRVHADLGTHEIHPERRTIGERDTGAVVVD